MDFSRSKPACGNKYLILRDHGRVHAEIWTSGSEPEYVGSRNQKRSQEASTESEALTSCKYQQLRDAVPKNNPEATEKCQKATLLVAQIRASRNFLSTLQAKIPADVRQEKGRELASLCLERKGRKLRERATKNLGKYHMVQIVERQKSEKKLKQLRKMLILEQDSRRRKVRRAQGHAANQASDNEMDTDKGGCLLPDPRELELEDRSSKQKPDLNYAIYAPLGEKYISLFPV